MAKTVEREDDSLFGLLSAYKKNCTYISILMKEDSDNIVLIVYKNPAIFNKIVGQNYKEYNSMRKIKMGLDKLFIKYLLPEHLIKNYGPTLGLKIPAEKVSIVNNLDDGGYFILTLPIEYKDKLIATIKKIVNLSPQKKYELIEKAIADEEVSKK